jgi:hypothetical protein
MANPNVDALVAEFSKALERWFDRTKNAINAARSGGYPFEQFATDSANTWMDSTYVTLLPLTLFAPFNISMASAFPVARFKLVTLNDAIRSIPVANLATAGNLNPENLVDASGNNQIPNGNITVTKTQGNTLMTVKLTNLAAMNPMPPAGLYRGRVIATGPNAPIAGIEVELP